LRQQLPEAVSLICEGGIGSAEQACRALADGADAVVVGTAITGVDLQVAAYRGAIG
jgi:N-acylglucosamine-6-phosphate 2-epimerase